MVQNTKLKNDEIQRRNVVIGIAVLAVIAVAAIIAFVFLGNRSTIDYSSIPQERTADGAFILGNPEAPITIVAWEDFLCPHCQSYESTVQDFIHEYVVTGKARFEFRMLPINASLSPIVFSLVECAEIQQAGSFWKARETMFHITSTSNFSQNSGRDFASQMGLPYGALLECSSTASQHNTDMALASQYGDYVTGTPAVGWRLNGGDVRFDIISRQPTVEELGVLIANFSN